MNSIEKLSVLYSEIVFEGTSSHRDFKEVMSILKKAMDNELVTAEETRNGYMIKSLVDKTQYLIHKGGKDFHPLRRYLQKLEKVAISA